MSVTAAPPTAATGAPLAAAPVDPKVAEEAAKKAAAAAAKAAGSKMKAALEHVVPPPAVAGAYVRAVVDAAINPKKDEPKSLLERAKKWLKDNAVEVTAVTTIGGALGYQTGALPVVASLAKTVATASPGSITIMGIPVDISLLSASAVGGASYLGVEGAIKCGKVLLDNKLVTGLTLGYLVLNGYTLPILGAVYSSGAWKPLVIGTAVKYSAPYVKAAADATAAKVKGAADTAYKATKAAAVAKATQAGTAIWNSRAMTAVRTAAAARWQQVTARGTEVRAAAAAGLQQAQALGRRALDAAANNLEVTGPAGVIAATVVAAGTGLISAPIAALVAGGVTAGAIVGHFQK